MTSPERCVVAYSGGLDTSAIIPWLHERGYEIHAVLVDLGQDEDLEALCARALELGAASAVIHDATAEMADTVLPFAIGLGAVYEGSYRLGTALARPFIALAQVRRAREVGATTLVHGATGKGNDQVRFEFAYRTLMPECSILAPWKTWDFGGRRELIEYLRTKGCHLPFEEAKDYSLDENLWHLSVEGGTLERPDDTICVTSILESVQDKFSPEGPPDAGRTPAPTSLDVTFAHGLPVAINGNPMPLIDILRTLNGQYRHADWAWDLVLENRFTGVKSRGIYINPAAKLLHTAIDGLARSCLSKTAFEQYKTTSATWADQLYRGEYFSQQRKITEAAAVAALAPLSGTVTVHLNPTPYVARIEAPNGLFQERLATFEASDYDHGHADGFIRLSWLSAIGAPQTEDSTHEGALEAGHPTPPVVSTVSSVPGRGLVPAAT